MRLPQNAPPKKSFQVPRYVVVMIVAIIVVLFVLILWFVYPETRMRDEASAVSAKPDEISIMYLRHEVSKNPDNLQLRLQLINDEIQLANLDKANALIKPYLDKQLDDNIAWQFKWYAFQTQFLKFTAKKNGKSKQKKIEDLHHLAESMQILAKAPLSNKQLIGLMKQSLEIKSYALTAQISHRLSAERHQLSAEDMELVAQYDYLAGDFLASAEFYMAAYAKHAKAESKKQAYVLAIKSLLAGNLLPTYFPLVLKESSQFKQDPEVMMMLAKAALASKQTALATKWMRQAIGLQYHPAKGGV